jgi:galactonate dehydratase
MTNIEEANIYRVPTGNRTGVLLELTADDGTRGIGEAGIAYGVGGDAVVELLREMLGRFVLGRGTVSIGGIWNDIYDRGFWTRNGGALTYGALSAIEIALWDLRGKRLGAPIHDLFGGRLWDRLPVYANGWWLGCDSPDEYAEAAGSTVARGFGGLKFYPLGMADPDSVVRHPVRRSIDSSLLPLVCDRVAAVREAVGPGVEIMLDFGGGLHTDQVLRICRRIEHLDIRFIEEPVDPSSLEALSRVAAGTSIPLAAGERAYGRPGCQRLLETGAISVLQPDVCNTGGLLEARMMAGMAEHQNIRVAPHNYGSELATVVAAQLGAIIPNFMLLECFPDFDREPGYRKVLETPLEGRVESGQMPLPDGPGLGVCLDDEAVRPWHRHRCRV